MNQINEDTSQTTHSEPEQWHERGELVELLGYSLFVIDESPDQNAIDSALELPTIILLHGFPTSSWDWQPMWHLLAKDFRLIAVDMLGFGFSDKPSKHKYSIHGQADLIEALVKAKQLQQFHVLTHDYGDTVGQELLSRQLEGSGAGEWLSCCFLNGGLFPETHRALLTQKLLLSPIGSLLNRFTGYAKFCRNLSSVFGAQSKPSEEQLENFWWLINHNDGKHIFHNLITYIRDRLEHRERWVSAMQQSTIPLGLINGSVDPVSGKHMVARYQELNCRLDYLAELPEIGHYPQVEAPAEVMVHYQNFLQTLPKV